MLFCIAESEIKVIHTYIQGIIKSIKFRDKLYFKMKQTPVNTQQYITLKINLKTYNGILRRSIRVAKTMYYHTTFEKCKHQQLVVSFLTILKLMETL